MKFTEIKNRIKNYFTRKRVVIYTEPWYTGYGQGSDLSDVTFYVCLKTLAESVGKMPVYIQDGDYNRKKDMPLAVLLGFAPNKHQTSAEFFTFLEFCRSYYGNGYAYIHWTDDGAVEEIIPLDPRKMLIWVSDDDYYYQYDSGPLIDKGDIIHVKSWMTDGYVGKPVKDILTDLVTGNKAGSEFQNDLYKSGLQANLIVKYVGDLNGKEQQAMLKSIQEVSSRANGRMLPIPKGWDAIPLDIKLTDAQFLETRKYTSLQLAAAFGIKPNYLNDYSKSSYANSASQNLSFYTDTLLYILSIYEQELTRKLLTTKQIRQGLEVKFNYSVILRADPQQQAEILAKYVGGSIYKINEARQKAGLPPIDDGDHIIMASGYTKA